MKSKDYWAKRAIALEYYIQQDAVKTREEILKLISEAAGNIDEEIYKICRELGKLTGMVTEEELNELLSSARRDKSYRELKELLDIAETDTERTDIMNRMNAQAYGARLTRYDEVANKILAEYTKVAHKERVLCKEFFSNVLCESYYTNIYNLAEGYNAGVSFDVLPRRAINKALQEKWHSSNYSERIWKHSQAFAEQVEQTIISGLMSGKSTPKMAMELDTFTKEDVYYVKERLIRTETSHFMAEGQKEAYKTAGIEKYRFMAALSERTCELCGELDGKTFSVEEATEGVNYPTIHPNCRCTTITADAKLSTRNARDPVTGKNYKVDGNMDFAQWKESLSDEQRACMTKYVDKFDKSGIINTKIINNVVTNPMSEERYYKMRNGLLKNGIKTIEAKNDDLRYLQAIKAEASYGHGYIMHIGKIPSASAMFEEVIHSTQAKIYGEFESSDIIELCAREIPANRMLLKNKIAYGFDDTDVEDVKKNLKHWEETFEREVGCSYDKSSYRREI